MRFQHLWMLYYYVSLALRENILKMNGSRINTWWITHHHFSSIASLIFLTWPHGPAYQKCKSPYLYFCVLQGFVQLIQNWYQKKRHYTLMSLGKASSMDITSTETISDVNISKKPFLVVLIPVFVTQFVQVYVGVIMLVNLFGSKNGNGNGNGNEVGLNPFQSPGNYREEMQTFAIGVLAIVLGIGNFVATMIALRKKAKKWSSSQGSQGSRTNEKEE